MNPVRKLASLGQSVWLDDIRRDWIEDGTLQRLIEEDGLAGLTSNPAIFDKAIGAGGAYAAAIGRLARAGVVPAAIYETLAVEDVRAAADLLRPTYEASAGLEGFVSLEVSPRLADDAAATVSEARRLWRTLDRPNTMIKVPATRAGLSAIRALLAEGVNVNVTLLFGLARYREVVEAFLEGLEQRAAANEPLERVASVASFFLSRIDTWVDRKLDAHGGVQAQVLRGRVAIACAKLAYAIYREWTVSGRWMRLRAHGGRAQRLLWASTSTKDPAYEDIKYVEGLIGAHTINTLPRATLEAYRDHGKPAPRLEKYLADARTVQAGLQSLDIDLDEAARQLERAGVQAFVAAFDRLLASLARADRAQSR